MFIKASNGSVCVNSRYIVRIYLEEKKTAKGPCYKVVMVTSDGCQTVYYEGSKNECERKMNELVEKI